MQVCISSRIFENMGDDKLNISYETRPKYGFVSLRKVQNDAEKRRKKRGKKIRHDLILATLENHKNVFASHSQTSIT